jgi:hypothetical protein
MEVGLGPNEGCSAKGKKIIIELDITDFILLIFIAPHFSSHTSIP